MIDREPNDHIQSEPEMRVAGKRWATPRVIVSEAANRTEAKYAVSHESYTAVGTILS